MWIFDAHLDIAMNGVDWNRDYRMAIQDIRVQETVLGMTELGRRTNTVSFPELLKAEVRLGLATVIARQEQAINHPMGWTTAEACYAVAIGQLAYYRAMEKRGWMQPIRTRADLILHAERTAANPASVPFGFILSMECADAILDHGDIHEWYGYGLRAIGITHYGTNRYG
ncbi:MAG: peptidase M19, partial [Gemmataceae bacterium]